MPYVWSYGMGAESTAAIFRMLSNPATRPDTIAPDFSNLIVVIAQTGDEWSTTGRLVQHFMLPLLRQHDIRLVEVARQGQTKKDGVAVLQDTRQPYRLHLEGVYKLSRENRVTGTMPQLGGVRKCPVDCTNRTRSRTVIVLIGRSGAHRAAARPREADAHRDCSWQLYSTAGPRGPAVESSRSAEPAPVAPPR